MDVGDRFYFEARVLLNGNITPDKLLESEIRKRAIFVVSKVGTRKRRNGDWVEEIEIKALDSGDTYIFSKELITEYGRKVELEGEQLLLVQRQAFLERMLDDYGPQIRRNDPSLRKNQDYIKLKKALEKVQRKLNRSY